MAVLYLLENFLELLGCLLSYKLFVIVCLPVVCICVYGVYLYYIHKKFDHIPGPKRDSFWFGNLFSLANCLDSGSCFFEYIHQNFEKYGSTFQFSIFHLTLIVTAEPDAVKEVLVSGHHPKPKSFRDTFFSVFGKRFLGEGLVTETNHEKWLRRRNLMNPYFQRSYIKTQIAEFNTSTDVLMKVLANFADGKTYIPMMKHLSLTSLDVFAKTAYNLDLNSLENEDNQFSQAISVAFKGNNEYQKRKYMVFNPKNWKYILEVRKAIDLIRKFGSGILHERAAAKSKGDYVPDDILTHFVKIREENPDIDETIIIDDFVTFFIAGQETTATLLAFLIIVLGKHPEVYQKLQNEIDNTVGGKSVIEYEDLSKLNYLDMVVKETLRLYPPVPVTSRALRQKCVIGGYDIPAGSDVLVSSYTSARMEDYFEDPLTFNPLRFSSDSERKVPTYNYFPFSIGPRTCIGKYFAEVEAKMIITKLLQRFQFKLDPDGPSGFADTSFLKPKGNVMCCLSLRE